MEVIPSIDRDLTTQTLKEKPSMLAVFACGDTNRFNHSQTPVNRRNPTATSHEAGADGSKWYQLHALRHNRWQSGSVWDVRTFSTSSRGGRALAVGRTKGWKRAKVGQLPEVNVTLGQRRIS